MKTKLSAIKLLLLSGCLIVCTGRIIYPASAQEAAWPNDDRWFDEEHVIAQVCEPNMRVAFQDITMDLSNVPKAETLSEARAKNSRGTASGQDRNVAVISPDQGDSAIVRRWVPGTEPAGVTSLTYTVMDIGRAHHVPSERSDTFFLIGNTEKNQPVFENLDDARIRLQDTIAFEIMKPANGAKSTDKIRYWYKVPQNISRDGFTPWQPAVSQESQAIYESQKFDTGYKLVTGKEMDYYPVSPDGPMMRFKIMTSRDFFNANRFWERELKAIRKKYYADWKDIVEPRTDFVSLRSEIIPGCQTTH